VPDDLDEMYRRHAPSIWRYVRARVPNDDEAQDVTSDVFVRAVKSHSRFDPFQGSEGAWLAGIARHVVADWWRHRPASIPTAQAVDPDPVVDDATGPEELAIRGDTAAAVRRHLLVLSDRERDAVALRFAAGLRSAEVGVVMGISEAAAKMLVYRAVCKLRAVMDVE
jgi:RNA polymerase sigma-70 factor (ECF subfamily)